MPLKEINIKDKGLFKKFLSLCPHTLSAYTFENIYIWKALFDIRWGVIQEHLCIFFRDKIGCFMYLPPLAKKVHPPVIREAFRVMDIFNRNPDISRIENIEEGNPGFYRKCGYALKDKYPEYLCQRIDLAQLKGNRFKSKRSTFNHFVKHNRYEYLPYSALYKKGCQKLHTEWQAQRKKVSQDPVYIGMLEDSQKCLQRLLADFRNLDLLGRVVKIEGEIKAFTFGFKINAETFCVLYEITDLSIRGLSQFIFREFCQELAHYKYINIMDDSGLKNLRRVKTSYAPIKLIPAYVATRKA